jgi:hypothetical protein
LSPSTTESQKSFNVTLYSFLSFADKDNCDAFDDLVGKNFFSFDNIKDVVVGEALPLSSSPTGGDGGNTDGVEISCSFSLLELLLSCLSIDGTGGMFATLVLKLEKLSVESTLADLVFPLSSTVSRSKLSFRLSGDRALLPCESTEAALAVLVEGALLITAH